MVSDREPNYHFAVTYLRIYVRNNVYLDFKFVLSQLGLKIRLEIFIWHCAGERGRDELVP